MNWSLSAETLWIWSNFVHDKAKRLFAKYEAASKERKVMQEEKNFYF